MMLEIDAPEYLRMTSDGTVAKELVVKKPFICTCCNGAGYHFTEDNTGRLVKTQCDVCLGYGELQANITVEWKPYIKL